ncbi:hypothetical protein A3K73_08670 [Candidatus Pacearchaeota archaeon RBG_13_36_9]|nr:MAG: hypothetical protein A3K73_08670 [Candidatus Pacearchaeota archaeon RBG_13_36_9]
MEQIKKEEARKPRKLILFLGISILVVLAAIIITVLTLKNPEVKDIVSESDSGEEGELGSINPIAKAQEVMGDLAEPSKENAEESGGSGGGGASWGGSGGGVSGDVGGVSGGGGEDAGIISAQSEDVKGSLEIDNLISRGYTSSSLGLAHYPGASEGTDSYDSRYYAMFDPSGIASKIISKVESYELDADIRPAESTTEVYLELSLVSQSGRDITINSPNELRLSMPLEGYNFGSQTLTLQQYNPENTSESYPEYDIRKLIEEENGAGTIKLPDLSGTYQSEKPYAYFKIKFS